MKKTSCALLLALFASAGARAECNAPEQPTLPDGAEAATIAAARPSATC